MLPVLAAQLHNFHKHRTNIWNKFIR